MGRPETLNTIIDSKKRIWVVIDYIHLVHGVIHSEPKYVLIYLVGSLRKTQTLTITDFDYYLEHKLFTIYGTN